MIMAVVAVLVIGLALAVVVAIARDKGPGPGDVAVSYELAWDRLDFESLFTLADTGHRGVEWRAEYWVQISRFLRSLESARHGLDRQYRDSLRHGRVPR